MRLLNKLIRKNVHLLISYVLHTLSQSNYDQTFKIDFSFQIDKFKVYFLSKCQVLQIRLYRKHVTYVCSMVDMHYTLIIWLYDMTNILFVRTYVY